MLVWGLFSRLRFMETNVNFPRLLATLTFLHSRARRPRLKCFEPRAQQPFSMPRPRTPETLNEGRNCQVTQRSPSAQKPGRRKTRLGFSNAWKSRFWEFHTCILIWAPASPLFELSQFYVQCLATSGEVLKKLCWTSMSNCVLHCLEHAIKNAWKTSLCTASPGLYSALPLRLRFFGFLLFPPARDRLAPFHHAWEERSKWVRRLIWISVTDPTFFLPLTDRVIQHFL